MNLILLGKPGAGKGTQAKKLSVKYKIPHISTGDMFRVAYAEKTEIGVLAHDNYWGKGNLVPDDITIKLVEERLKRDDCKKGFILDGFPRTLNQAKALESIVSIDYVLYLDAPDGLCVKRIAGRRNCPTCMKDYNVYFNPPKKDDLCDKCNIGLMQRKDDTEKIVKERLIVYEKETAPLIKYYDKQLVAIMDNGKKSIDELFVEVTKKLK